MYIDEATREIEFHKQQQQLTAGELIYFCLFSSSMCVSNQREFVNTI